jgi:ABC-type phosphate transport system permease subunit
MRAGGIWSPLLGTLYLVVISLVIATPVGVLAAVFLNEYARDNWLTRVVNLAVVNLAGVPSIVHALFGLGAFVLFAGLGKSILAASLTLASGRCRYYREHQRGSSPARALQKRRATAGRRSATWSCPTRSAAS